MIYRHAQKRDLAGDVVLIAAGAVFGRIDILN